MPVLKELRGLLQRPPLRVIVLSSILVVIVVLSLDSRTAVRDPDNWWHLKVGQWIVENHSVPHVGIFSRTAANKPWMAYSWGYEVLLSRSYDYFGLIGLTTFGLALTLAVAAALYWMLFRLSRSFWIACVLCGVGSYAFLFKLLPRPVFFSMALFSIVLMLILEAHRESRIGYLYPLPFIFILWANFHIQFVYGLFALGLLAVTTLAQRLLYRYQVKTGVLAGNSLPISKLLLIFAVCVLACGVGPYGFHLFGIIANLSASLLPYTFVRELQAPDFKYLPDYVLLLLMGAGYFALGWQKRIDVFKILLLATASIFAFRTSRDVWFVAICAAAFIADLTARTENDLNTLKAPGNYKSWEFASVAVVTVIMGLFIAPGMGLTTRRLDRTISATFPVDAVNYLRKNPAPGPLYNEFNWGGFLIWYMPDFPVSIDGRTDLYGDEATGIALRSLGGDYASDPYLNEAGVVILNKATPLPWKLSSDERFRIVYQDKLAAVFVRNR